MSAERLDPDHDVGSITWYPFDWTAGGPNSAYSPLRKSLIWSLLNRIFLSSFITTSCDDLCRITDDRNCIYEFFRFTRRLDYLNPLAVANHLLVYSPKRI